MNLKTFICTLALLVFVAACNSGGGTTPSPPSPGVSVTPGTSTLVAGGSGLQLSATLTLGSGVVDNTATFTWTSDDPAIVSVDAGGLASGLNVGVAKITATSGTSTGTAVVWVMSPNPGAKSLSLTGTARYEDREYGPQGFTGTLTPKPIRNVVIEVVAIDGFQVIGTGATDALGNFDLTVDNSANNAGVYLRLLSQTVANHSEKIEVRNNDSENEVLWFISPGIDDSVSEPFSATQDMLATAAAKIGGAFNIIDVMSDASALVQASGPCTAPNTACIPPLAKVFWEPGSAKGTFYDANADAISILGGGVPGGDTDEYDDVILAHEYAHFIISKFSRDDSPGGQHSVLDNAQDIRLSWSEGWATFFPAAVLNSPWYVDTAPGGTLASFNIEDYSGLSALDSNAIYTTNEIAVAGVLWDLFDGVNNSEGDALALGFMDIFQTVLNFPPSPKPTSLETFWTTFLSAQSASDSNNFQTILRGRQIALFADTGEGGEATLVANGARQTHTLYQNAADPAGDVDVIPFSASTDTTYTIKTLNLKNGADTLLTIRGPSSELIGSNDNASGLQYPGCGVNPFTGVSTCPANNASNLSSSVTFTSQTGGSYTAEVTRSADAPPSAGLLGEYEIELTTGP